MVVKIRRGLDLRYDGAPRQVIADGPPIDSVAILGADYPGIRLEALVEPGHEVGAGQPLLRDRKSPDRLVVSPVSARVANVTRGARRNIASVELSVGGTGRTDFPIPATLDRPALVALLLASGLWAALLTRPFGRPPHLVDLPEALFITAMDTRPHAADPAVVVAAHAAWFRRGAAALALLTSGKTYLCHADGAPMPEVAGVTAVAFSGPHPAGLPSTHIHHLHPVGRGARTVWQIGYQDVIALGHLLETGTIWTTRIVAVSGPAVSAPALLRTLPGANLRQLTHGLLRTDAVRPHAGSAIDGSDQAYLSRGHLQVFAMPHRTVSPNAGRVHHLISGWLPGSTPAIIPNEAHERVAPAGILPVPLLRALSIGDIETASQLGAFELVEEDMALLSHVDGSGADFGAMLRQALDELAAQ